MSEDSFPNREDVTRLSEVGTFISAYVTRPDRSKYVTREHERAMVKIFKFMMDFVEKREQES